MIVRFGAFVLDTELFELRQAGQRVAVEPQVFDVLRYLVEHRDRVVSKEELLDNVWGDRFVSESALTSRLKSARRAVGDDGRSQQVIRTLHGRGYRFVADATELGSGGTGAGTVAAPTELAPLGHGDRTESRTGSTQIWPLVGRAAELEALAQRLATRSVGGVLLTGGPGVGKSRLAAECLDLAVQAGVEVERVIGHAETSSIPFAAVAHLIPADAVAGRDPDGELDRAALFHRARTAVVERSKDRRLMLVVDDVDRLDESSRALLSSLVTSAGVFALLTQRTDDTTVPAVAELLKDGHLEELHLGPLPEEMLDVLLHRVLGGPLLRPSLLQLAEASTGNPGMLRQLVQSSIEHGSLIEEDGVWRLTGPLHAPPSLRAAVEERLAINEPAQERALELLALSGQLGLTVIAALVGEDVLDRLDRRGLLQIDVRGRRTEAALAHPLFGEVLRDRLGPLAARRLRSELIRAIEATGARRRDDQLRLVAWWLDTGGDVDPELLLGAARLALIEHDDALAERLVQRVIATDPSAAAVQLEAELHFRRGQHDRVEKLLGGVDLSEVEPSRRIEIIRRRASNLFLNRWEFERAIEVLAEGCQALDDPAARLHLDSHRLLLQVLLGDLRGVAEEVPGLLARAEGRPRLEVLMAAALAAAASGRAQEVLPLVAEGRQLQHHTTRGRSVLTPSLLDFGEVSGLIGVGRFADARATIERGRQARHDPRSGGWLAIAAARLNLLEGRTLSVRTELDAMVRQTRALGQVPTERWLLGLVASARWLDGDRATAAEEVDRVRDLLGNENGLFRSDMDRVIGWVAAARDGLDAGVATLVAAAERARHFGRHAFEAMLLSDVTRLGRPEAVVERLTELGAAVHGQLVAARLDHAVGAVEGDPDRVEQAIDAFDGMGMLPEAVDAAMDLARLLSRTGRDASAAGARADELARRRGGRLVGLGPRLDD